MSSIASELFASKWNLIPLGKSLSIVWFKTFMLLPLAYELCGLKFIISPVTIIVNIKYFKAFNMILSGHETVYVKRIYRYI